jgi:hypothetical protein
LCKHDYFKHVAQVLTGRTQIDDFENMCGTERHTGNGNETPKERDLMEKLGVYEKIEVMQNRLKGLVIRLWISIT